MYQQHKKLIIALLAAGGSRRFKGAKLAATLPTSQNAMILDSYAKLKQLTQRVNIEGDTNLELELVVILGGHQAILQPLLPDTAHCVVNSQWALGLSTSVKCAAHYAKRQQASGLMLTLADQVAINSEDYLQLITLWLQVKQTVASEYLNAPGVPAIFNHDDLADFSMLHGDRGAKPVLMKHKAQNRLDLLPLDCAAWDIDTRDELERWKQE
ncbi:nucleotidyltransferase family protein [uncultured Shewanella sp.]|uniref:nucleotidyltransferase family protein n=1 Tax=uncultured Shewanella sp. TaxID=173975 RepID=UPI002628C93F|nr:nucleotidyltransferase family protein [uncultured Shewanella sp.]